MKCLAAMSNNLLGMQTVCSPPGPRNSHVCGGRDSPTAQSDDRPDIHPPLAGGGTALTSGNVWRGRSHDCSLHTTRGNSSTSPIPKEKKAQRYKVRSPYFPQVTKFVMIKVGLC